MIQKIRVKELQKHIKANESLLKDINQLVTSAAINGIEVVKVYRLDGITKQQADFLAQKLFCEQITQSYSVNKYLLDKSCTVFEISYKPGVMNPEVASILKSAHDLGIHPTTVDTSKEYGFFGEATREELEQMLLRIKLFNPLIEYIRPTDDPVATIPLTIMTDDELIELSADKLFLNLEEMKTIQRYFKKLKRNPTDAELETLAQTWSEHCAHKTFKATLIVDGKKRKPLMTRIKNQALKHKKNIVSAFVDNSGVMDFYDDQAICGKAETHNSPSAIEPYGGAMTGSGGVFRDVLGTGLGAKNIASTDIFCFAPPGTDPATLPLGTLPPDYLLKRVVAGVRDYGNRIGIPTNNGSLHFHHDFRAKPTVIVGAYGIIPKAMAKKGEPKIGDLVVAVGGRTGRDGIHGATFSSGEMTDRTISVNAQAVQIGNAIEEKRTFDAILEARDNGCIHAIQDCGAGGFSSAIGELGEQIGVTIHLEKAPVKYEGLRPWEIWVSESQERIILAVPKIKQTELRQICKRYNVEASFLGEFNGSKKLHVFYEDEIVCNLDMEFLHHGLSHRTMIATKPSTSNVVLNRSQDDVPTPKTKQDWNQVLGKILSHGNICSKEPIVRLYDHTVQGRNVIPPYSGAQMDGPTDAAVIRPLLEKPYGMVISHGLNPILTRLDPYQGSIWAATESLANYVSVGGNYKESSLINNYIWPFPDEENLWSLDQSVNAVVDFMSALQIPVISGKDSLSSTYRGKDGTVIRIPPVLCISAFGRIPDVSKTMTSDLKKENSLLYLIGKSDFDAMGGSTYFDIYNLVGKSIPKISLQVLPKVLEAIQKAIANEQVLSVHDISEGGVLTSLFEMCVGGNLGAAIDLKPFKNQRPDYVLFNETAGTFIVEVADEKTAKKIFSAVPYTVLGKTQKRKIIAVNNGPQKLFDTNIESLKKLWKEPMQKLFV
ncbi:MAG: phosphoribosylformylglycinamidine synthase subunit PurL [Candidatus Levybacteria bacterium]|nr:phosphoribosylformylglycinamidine synthase subunit PurL [Candidatus Levybacteria bacterium]